MGRMIDARVFSKKSDKTLTVMLVRRREHKAYRKHTTTRTKLQVHDELNMFRVGDMVRIISCRPLSRLKRWKVLYDNTTDDSVRNPPPSIR